MGLADVIFGTAKSTRGRMERMVREAGFSIAEKRGKALVLECEGIEHPLFITDGDAAWVMFAMVSAAEFKPDGIPPEVMQFALMQNDEHGAAKWCVDDDTSFVLSYPALGSALTLGEVKMICDEIVEKVIAFEKHLKKGGYL